MDHYQKIKHVPWSIKNISILGVLLAFQPLYFEPPIEPSMIKALLKANFILVFLFLLVFSSSAGHAQQYGGFPLIEKDPLLLDFELLKQGLEKYHTGLYWYTSKDSFDGAFARAKSKINRDMNVLEFHKAIAPLISMSKEAHTALVLPQSINNGIREKATFLPLMVKFLGTDLYVTEDLSFSSEKVKFRKIKMINGETPDEIISKLGTLYASDGNIQLTKYFYLDHFDFALNYYYYYGEVDSFEVEMEGQDSTFRLEPLTLPQINRKIEERYGKREPSAASVIAPLEFQILRDSVAVLSINTFSNSRIQIQSNHRTLKNFLKKSFKTIAEKKIETIIIDVSKNDGGDEGNEGHLYSYIGNNYQKYHTVMAKAQKSFLDNRVDEPITLKTFGLLERLFTTKKMADGGIRRRNGLFGHGLMAYSKEPKYKYQGENIFIIIGPGTYSGGSEFASMAYSQNIGVFVGQETGGGYYGNTSGYREEYVLPHSKIQVEIPALQFKLNVEEKIPFGRGVIPHYEVIPTIKQYKDKEHAPLNFIFDFLSKE